MYSKRKEWERLGSESEKECMEKKQRVTDNKRRHEVMFILHSMSIVSADFVMCRIEMHGTYLRFLVSSSSANVVVFLALDLSPSPFFLRRPSSSFA